MIRAIELYHSLLARDPAATREMAERVERELARRGLRFGAHAVRTALRPHFLSPEQMRRLRRVCSVLLGCFAKIEALTLRDRTVLARLGLPEAECDLAAIDPGFEGSAIFARLDCFFATARDFHFVEFNVDSPGGAAYLDEMQSILLAEPIVQEFQRSYTLRAPASRRLILESLLGCYRQWGGVNPTPRIAIVDWTDVPTASEFELLRQFFEESGYPAVVCDPRELLFLDGRLVVAGAAVDIVYKRVLVTELLARPPAGSALIDAVRRRAVCMVNPFRGKIINVKALFDILTHERYRRLFSAREHLVIRRHIPWTRVVEETKTYYRSSKIDLPDFIRKNRHVLVLKPNDDYGGKGVVLGWEASPAAWEEALARALQSGGYVVQRRVPIPEAVFPVWEDGLRFESLSYDTDPYFFSGQTAGCLTRLSGSALLNVTAGGGFVPSFEIRKARPPLRRSVRVSPG